MVRVANLARASGMNEVALLRKLKQKFGDSPYQYVLTRRVERATDLIGSACTRSEPAAAANGRSGAIPAAD